MGINEYFDPIYFLKKKFTDEPEGVRPEEYKIFEKDFQKFVDIVFLFSNRQQKFPHLKGFKVLKVTPEREGWKALLKPVVSDWFNYQENSSYKEKLKTYFEFFKETSRHMGIDSPADQKGVPGNINYYLWL